MKCPHCLENFTAEFNVASLGTDTNFEFNISWCNCPGCYKKIIKLSKFAHHQSPKPTTVLIYPKAIARAPLSTDVPEKFTTDYREACVVLADSVKASAALSRYCLQNLLREKAGIKKSDLSKEIEQVLDANTLPPYIAADLDAVRNIGNFATHPIKSTNTGEIVEVEEGEAEWNLNVLEELFEFYFVQPAIAEKKREALNKKLADAGKPPMKQPTTVG